MITPDSVVARASGQLTGGGAKDWCASIDTCDTFDGQVTVQVTGTKGSLDNIVLSFHAGPNPSPTHIVSDGTVMAYETITAASWGRSVTVKTCARYLRAAVAGTGSNPAGSDATVSYYYLPKQAVMVAELRDGTLAINT